MSRCAERSRKSLKEDNSSHCQLGPPVFSKYISYKIETQKKGLPVCHVGVRGGQLVKGLIALTLLRWKAIPQMCPTVAETTFQKIGTVLRQSHTLYAT